MDGEKSEAQEARNASYERRDEGGGYIFFGRCREEDGQARAFLRPQRLLSGNPRGSGWLSDNPDAANRAL